jgi:glycosyltransferase 2 family protein
MPRMSDQQGRLVRLGSWASRAGSLDPEYPLLRRGLHIGIGLLLVLGVALAVSAALNELPEVDWRWRPVSLLLGIAGVALFMWLSAEIWRRLLHALGPHLPVPVATRIWFVSGLGRFVPTSLLLPVVRAAMSEREGVPKRICLASIVYELAVAVTGALVVAAYGVITLPDLQGHWERWFVIALPVIALLILQPAVFHNVADLVLVRLGRERLPRSLSTWRVAEFVGLYCIAYFVAGLSVYLLGQSVYPLGADDLVTAIGAYALGAVLGLVAFLLPAGLIAREAGIAVGLTAIMPTAPAVAIAVLVRMVQIGVELVAVAVTVAYSRAAGGSDQPDFGGSPGSSPSTVARS